MLFCKFTVEFFSCFAVSFIGFFSSIKASEMFSFAVYFYSSDKKSLVFGKANASETGSVIFKRPDINQILSGSSVSEIFPSIVRAISVLMVYFKFWPFACHPKPDYSMNHIINVGNSDFQTKTISSFSFGSRWIANMNSLGQAFFPSQYSGLGIIIKSFSDKFCREIVMRPFVCHRFMVAIVDGIVN